MDEEKKGRLTQDGIRTAFRRRGQKLSAEEVQGIMEELDEGKASLNFERFCNFMAGETSSAMGSTLTENWVEYKTRKTIDLANSGHVSP